MFNLCPEKEIDLSKVSASCERLKYRQTWKELIHHEIEPHNKRQPQKIKENTDVKCELCTETSLKNDHEENSNPKWVEQIELITDVTESKDKLAAMNKLNDQRDLFVAGFLNNQRTLGIVVHSHEVNTQEHPNFAVNRVSVNIYIGHPCSQ